MISRRHKDRILVLCPGQTTQAGALEQLINEVWALRVLDDWRRVNGRDWRMTLGGVCELRDEHAMGPWKQFPGAWARLVAAEYICDHVPDMYHWRESR